MHILFSTDKPRRPTPEWLVRLGMMLRRFRHWLRGLRWWAMTALLLTVVTVVAALTEQDIRTVLAAGFAAVVLAVLATMEV